MITLYALRALNALLLGRASRERGASLAQTFLDGPREAPSEREQQGEPAVLRLVADGRTNDEIAATLKLTPNTIKGYLTVVYEKLGVRTRTQAAIHAIRHRMVE